MTTPVLDDIYTTSTGKQVLVTRDPVYIHPAIQNGRYIGRKPQDYFILAIIVTILNPLIGPLALIFSYMSRTAYKDGDLTHANKWANHAFFAAITTVIISVVIYIAIGFAVAGPNLRGGHSY